MKKISFEVFILSIVLAGLFSSTAPAAVSDVDQDSNSVPFSIYDAKTAHLWEYLSAEPGKDDGSVGVIEEAQPLPVITAMPARMKEASDKPHNESRETLISDQEAIPESFYRIVRTDGFEGENPDLAKAEKNKKAPVKIRGVWMG